MKKTIWTLRAGVLLLLVGSPPAAPVAAEEGRVALTHPYHELRCIHYGTDYRNPCREPQLYDLPPSIIVVQPWPHPSTGSGWGEPVEPQTPPHRPSLRDMHRNRIGGNHERR